METLYRIVLAVHIVAATLGLLTMLPPLLVKKGARVHRKVGFVFAYSMGTVAITGFFLTANWLLDPALFRPGVSAQAARIDAMFLSSIAALTGNAIVQAIWAIKRKRHPEPSRDRVELGSLAVLALSGLVSLSVGIATGHVLSMAFGALNLALGARDARFSLRPLDSRHAYIYQHIRAMGTACVSAITAFLVLGGRRIFHFDTFGESAWLYWVLPGAIGVPLFQLWVLVYQRKLEGKAALARRPPLDVTA